MLCSEILLGRLSIEVFFSCSIYEGVIRGISDSLPLTPTSINSTSLPNFPLFLLILPTKTQSTKTIHSTIHPFLFFPLSLRFSMNPTLLPPTRFQSPIPMFPFPCPPFHLLYVIFCHCLIYISSKPM